MEDILIEDGVNCLEWGKNQLLESIRRLIEDPKWREGFNHVPGERDVGKEIVERYYAKQRGTEKFKGCATCTDFRELLEKEKDVNAVKMMTARITNVPEANKYLAREYRKGWEL